MSVIMRLMPPLTCAVFPKPHQQDPYQALFLEQLAKRGVVLLTDAKLTPMWALRTKVTAIHLHWVEYLFVARRKPAKTQWTVSAGLVARLIISLILLRARGIRIVWTIHNIAPHEPRCPRLERVAFRVIARLATALLLHSHWAAGRAIDEFGRHVEKKIRVGPHGNYIDFYKEDYRARSVIRKELNVPDDAFVYLIFGNLRDYKRVPEAIEAFRALTCDDVALVIAGSVHDRNLQNRIESAAAGDLRIRMEIGFVADEGVGALFAAADAVILNYAEVFSSGALLVALSFGAPVVAPKRGSATEVAGPDAVEAFEEGRLLDALERIREGDLAMRREAARDASRRASWERLAEAAIAAYEGRTSPKLPSRKLHARG